ncbi:MAG TPA: histidine phosphatase family protein [Thermoanaerobaculia bacterium]|jgi:broad specificity phosphatase PhoE
MPTTLLLVRHAHTHANALDATPRMAGWTDFPLSESGEEQLAQLARLQFPDAAPTLYASTLERARRTAEVIAHGKTILAVRALREICCGDVDGWPVARVEQQHRELWERNLSQDDDDFRWPGGESYRELRQRVLRAIRGIASRHPEERVVVVTHTGVIAQLAGYATGVRPAAWERWRPGNGSVTTIEWTGGGGGSDAARLIDFDCRVHLAHPHGG